MSTQNVDAVAPEATVVIPPPEIRKLADTTADYVAKNGPSFEVMVMEKESSNAKFSFLKKDDLYRAYYDQKIAELARQAAQERSRQQQAQGQLLARGGVEVQEGAAVIKSVIAGSESVQGKQVTQQIQQQQQVLGLLQGTEDKQNKSLKDVKAPENDKFVVEPPRNLSQLDVDVIKHTAQFVAKNGRKFLVALTEREKLNPQFEFLKPTHELFSFFMNLVDAYTHCLNISKNTLDKIVLNLRDRSSILNHCGDIFEYQNLLRNNQKKQEEMDEAEREQMAAIDWNDFVVLETIDFPDDENSVPVRSGAAATAYAPPQTQPPNLPPPLLTNAAQQNAKFPTSGSAATTDANYASSSVSGAAALPSKQTNPLRGAGAPSLPPPLRQSSSADAIRPPPLIPTQAPSGPFNVVRPTPFSIIPPNQFNVPAPSPFNIAPSNQFNGAPPPPPPPLPPPPLGPFNVAPPSPFNVAPVSFQQNLNAGNNNSAAYASSSTLTYPRPVEGQQTMQPEVAYFGAEAKLKQDLGRRRGGQGNATGANLHDLGSTTCVVCGAKVPISQYNDHLRSDLVNPRHAEIREELETRGLERTLAPGADLATTLERLAERRPDIFNFLQQGALPAEGNG